MITPLWAEFATFTTVSAAGTAWLSAIHESAHACVAFTLGVPVYRVVVLEPRRPTEAPVSGIYDGWMSPRRLLEESPTVVAKVYLAGPLGQRRVDPLAALDLWHNGMGDLEEATQALARKYGQAPESRVVQRALRREITATDRLVDRQWRWIERVAVALLANGGRLTGGQVLGLRGAP